MFRSAVIFLVAGILMLTPHAASAATATFFGPIVPPECNCAAGSAENPSDGPSAPDWGCVLQIVQNTINFGVSMIVIMITLMIAYSGIMFMVNPTNAEQRSAARGMVTNAFIGLAIVLSAWLIVDFVMKQVFNEDASVNGSKVGPWNAILSEGDASKKCLVATATPTGPLVTGDETGDQFTPQPTTPGTPSPSSLAPAAPSGTPAPGPENGTATTRPAAPQGFTVSLSGTTANLSWTKSSDASVDRYSVDRAKAGDATYTGLTYRDVNQLSYTDTGLTAGVTYTYRIFAYNEAGNSVAASKAVTTSGGTSSGSEGQNWTEDERATRASFKSFGVTVNNPDSCPAGERYQTYLSRTGRKCTTVAGLTSITESQIKIMADKWGGFTITGGTEAGHETHGAGNRFDATGSNLGSKIKAFAAATAGQIKSSGIEAGTSGIYADSCGNTYYNEGDHWHITVWQPCSL